MKIYWTTLCLLFSFTMLQAQDGFFDRPAFTISLYNHSVGIPFKDFVKRPLNFGVAIGAEFSYPGKSSDKRFQRLELGFYHHKNLNTAVWVKTDFIRRFKTENGLMGEVQVGAGYIRDFNAYQTFELGSDGKYQAKKRASTGGFITGIGIGGGYELNINDQYAVTPFVRYESFLQMPYNDLSPYFPHSLLHLGSRFQIIK